MRGRGRLVLLGGEAGIGKTTLARDLAAEATARGVRVLTGACYDLTNTPPYGPWLDLFEACARDHDLPPPPAAFASGRLEPVTDQAALFAEVRAFFAELAATGPALLLLEDLHWADPASLELLRHLAPRLRHWPILLLVTYRGDELTRRHPFAVQLPALVREADGLRLDLRRLDVAALRALVAARYRLSAADEARLVAYLDRHAEGNPFFATELLRALQEEALLRPADDGWTLGGLDRVVLPSFLRQVIEGRVARLGEATRKPLAIAAVIGQEVPLALWAEVADLDDEALLTIVERAVDAHLLEADPDGRRVRFVHALTREALYEGILPPRRRLWHRRVGEALVAGTRPDPDAVAYHFQAAGDPRAGEWLLAAGDRAQRAYAWLTAAERLRAAAALLEDVEGQERTRGRLACRVAYLKRFSDPAGAIEALDDAARRRRADRRRRHGRRGPLAARASALLRGPVPVRARRDDRGHRGARGDAPGADAGARRDPGLARRCAPGRDQCRRRRTSTARLRRDAADSVAWRGASLGRFLASAGHLRAAVDDCERFVAVLAAVPEARSGIRAAVAFASHGLGIAQAGLGRPEEARRRSRRPARDLRGTRPPRPGRLHAARRIARRRADLRRGGSRRSAPARGRGGGGAGPDRRRPPSGRLAPPGLARLPRPRRSLAGGGPDPARPAAPGNAYLRREITAARAVLARHRGDPERAWEEIRPLLPGRTGDRARRPDPPGGALPPAPRGRPLPRRG